MLPAGFQESSTLIQGLDQCLLAGLSNLDHSHLDSLRGLLRVYGDTPLGAALAESVDGLVNGLFQVESCLHLAAVRAALQGAQYAALSQQLGQHLGRPAPAEDDALFAAAPAQAAPPLLDSVRHWLTDLAVTGFARLDASSLSAFTPTLTQLQAQAEFLPTALLLTGFLNELQAPPEPLPLFRWGDLWTRTMLSTLRTPAPAARPVSGTLYPLGLHWQQHPQFISMVCHALLEAEGRPSLVRLTLSAYKVPAIPQEQLWLLFPQAALLLESLASGKALKLSQMRLRADGHLLWDEQAAALGGSYKLMPLALQHFAPQAAQPLPALMLPPAQRHPVHLAEPLALLGCQVQQVGADQVVESGPLRYRLALHQDGASLSLEDIAAADQLFGLLRFDAGEWYFQVLAASKGKGKVMVIGKEGSKMLKKAPRNNALSILQERASRLLREKA